jgi:hypothetical protein
MTLRVLVEFVPDFEGDEQRELARAEIHGARISGMIGDYSLIVREGSNPLADTRAWTAAGDILGHDRAQTVWALVNKVSMFGWLAATRNGSPAKDLCIAAAAARALPESAADSLLQIAEATAKMTELRANALTANELSKDLRGCPKCDAVMGPRWKFCAVCGERGNE